MRLPLGRVRPGQLRGIPSQQGFVVWGGRLQGGRVWSLGILVEGFRV